MTKSYISRMCIQSSSYVLVNKINFSHSFRVKGEENVYHRDEENEKAKEVKDKKIFSELSPIIFFPDNLFQS